VQEVTISQAAELLGISQATVKRRLRQGVMTGRQEARPQGYRWMVEVDQDRINHQVTTHASEGDSDGHSTGAAELTALIAVLQAQVQAQGEELDARRREVQELHVLLQTAQAALTAPESRPWWRLW